ncbi:hypothetical protein Plhal304r1_c068g0155921 [Plasmopara halstedii]
MFVPILSTVFLLDVSISSASNSSIVQLQDPVVIVHQLNYPLPSANSSLTAAEGELENYDDSEQDNFDIDEAGGEMRMLHSIKKNIPLYLRSHLLFKEATNSLQSTQNDAKALLEKNGRSLDETKKLFAHLAKLLESDDGDLKLFARMTISKFLKDSSTTEDAQYQLLHIQTKLSTVFDCLMSHVEDEALEGFFKDGLHVLLLSYAGKLFSFEGILVDQASILEDVARFLTANRNGGDLITWLGTYQSAVDLYYYVFRLISNLVRFDRTRELGYRLQSLQINNLGESRYDLHKLSWMLKRDRGLEYAAYTRFNFIEHESKSRVFVGRQLYFFLSHTELLKKEEQIDFFLKMLSADVGPETKDLEEIDWSMLTDDQMRLFKAALQSPDLAKLVREALEAENQVASVEKELGYETVGKALMAVMNDNDLMQSLKAELNEEELVRLLKASLDDDKHLENLPLLLTHGDFKLKLNQKELQALVTNMQKILPYFKLSLLDGKRVTLLEKALELEARFNLVEDMLSSTELNTAKSLEVILNDQGIVQLLKKIVENPNHLMEFRSVLEDKGCMPKFTTALGDTNLAKVLDAVLRNIDLVFFLRVAIKDDDRVKLFRAALEKKEQVNEFLEALDKKKLANVFRSILEEEHQVRLLRKAVSVDHREAFKNALNLRDRKMLKEEMVTYLKSVDVKIISSDSVCSTPRSKKYVYFYILVPNTFRPKRRSAHLALFHQALHCVLNEAPAKIPSSPVAVTGANTSRSMPMLRFPTSSDAPFPLEPLVASKFSATHPALIETDELTFQTPFFRHMYFHAARVQGPLSLGSGISAVLVAYWQSRRGPHVGMPRLWLSSGCLIGAIVPFTVIKMFTLYNNLVDFKGCLHSGQL